MKGLYMFSWMKPVVEDFDFERDAKDLHIKKRLTDLTLTGTGILKGILNEIEVYVVDPLQFLEVKVKTGGAYIQSEKIEIDSEQTVNLDDVETEANIIWLKYKLDDSIDPQAVRNHPITGVPYIVWKVDSYELGATKESLFVEADDIIKLARVAKVVSDLTVTHDYRDWLKFAADVLPNYVNESEFYVGGPEGTGTKLLKQRSAPPVPHHLDLSTGWDDVYRKTGAPVGLVSFRPSYIKAEFGDQGTGTASGETFTKTSNRVGDWVIDEWQDQYLTCADGNSWKVLSNTVDTLTLESGAVPVNGAFYLGPNAAGYKFVIQTLDPTSEEVVAVSEVEAQSAESPVKMEFILHNMTPDVKYKLKVASKGGWHQDEWSVFCSTEEIIAGGPKEIPDVCGDVLDGEPTIEAADDGIRISWSVKSEYVSKVAGFEICWTDDGTTTPDFNNKNHRKIFTDRNYVVLPAKMSSETATITVKAKMRCVDKAGRHCTTPKTLTDTNSKKYPADLSDIVTDYKNIITPGSFGTLKDFLSQSIVLETGRGKAISEAESELADARSGYKSLGARILAILSGNIDWAYVRVVAKNNTGQYSTVQAAVNSLQTSDPYLILVNNDGGYGYDEQITIPSGIHVGLVGLGKNILIGPNQGRVTVQSGGGVFLLSGLYITCDGNQEYPAIVNLILNSSYLPIIEDVSIWTKGTELTEMESIRLNIPTGDPFKIKMRDVSLVSNYGHNISIVGSNPESIKIRMRNVEMQTSNLATGKLCLISAVNNTKIWSWGDVLCNRVVGASYTIQCTSTVGNNLWPAHNCYNLPADPTNLTIDYGAITGGEVSNVTFDGTDLEVLI